MLQEIALLIDHNMNKYCLQFLFNYQSSIEDSTESFRILVNDPIPYRTGLKKSQIEELIIFLQYYLIKLESVD